MSTARDSSFGPTNGVNVASATYSASQREMIREQLERILASSLFRNSKRFPDFLRYTVNQALSGETDSVKERTLGVAVFSRDPNYDTSVDPVVRVTAAEVRKRITQYYQTIGHERELRIEFERGSYIPEFIFPDQISRREESQPVAQIAPTRRKPKKNWLRIAAIAVPCAGLCMFLLGSTRQTALDRFWGPVVSAKNTALLCIPGQGASPSAAAPTAGAANVAGSGSAMPKWPASTPGQVTLGDSVALAMVSGVLGSKGKDFHVRAAGDVNLDDLKEGPVVLIGAFSNQWTMRLAGGLRYTFEHNDSLFYIGDARNPSSREWAIPDGPVPPGESVDYGLISRVIDATTGRAMVTAGGIHHFGTEAAAECLTDANCLEAAAKLAPGDWKKMNLQVVLKTTVIGENSGQPEVLAAYDW